MRKLNKAKATKAAKTVPAPAKAAKAVPAPKPEPVAAAPVAAKPVTPADKAAAVAERTALIGGARKLVSSVYTGSSPVIHSSKPGKHGDYAARCINPVQTVRDCDINQNTQRDDSLLACLHHYADAKSRAFDPVKLACDLGAISRAASTGAIRYTPETDTFALTDTGGARAKLIYGKYTTAA